MKMNFNFDLKNLQKFLSISAISRNAGSFFRKKVQFFILLIMFLSAAYLVFLWYAHIFSSQWDETRVNEYIQTKQSKSETVFNRENFQKVIDESSARSAEFEKPLENGEDIFRLNK